MNQFWGSTHGYIIGLKAPFDLLKVTVHEHAQNMRQRAAYAKMLEMLGDKSMDGFKDRDKWIDAQCSAECARDIKTFMNKLNDMPVGRRTPALSIKLEIERLNGEIEFQSKKMEKLRLLLRVLVLPECRSDSRWRFWMKGPPPKLSPAETQALIDKLAAMDDAGRSIAPTTQSRAEAEAAVGAYLKGAIGEPSRPKRQGEGDFVDSQGEHLDVKSFYSRDELIARIQQDALARGRMPPPFKPDQRVRGAFRLNDALEELRFQKLIGRRVILDTRNLNAADKKALEDAVNADPGLRGNVIWHP